MKAVIILAALWSTAAHASWQHVGDSDACLYRDDQTGLTWGETVSDRISQDLAASNCAALAMRLPTLQEVASARQHGLYSLNDEHGCLGDHEWFIWTSQAGTYVSLKNGVTGSFLNRIKYKCVTGSAVPGGGPQPLPTPSAPPLPPPRDQATPDEVLHRHAVATVNALHALRAGNCVVKMRSHGYQFVQGTHDYRLGVVVGETEESPAYFSYVSADRSPTEVARLLATTLADRCSFTSEASLERSTFLRIRNGFSHARTQLDQMREAVSDSDLVGKLNVPTILISGNEIIVNDPVDLDIQKDLLRQVREGLPERGITVDNPNAPASDYTKTWGRTDVIAMRVTAETQQPNTLNYASSSARFDLILGGNTYDLLDAKAASQYVSNEISQQSITVSVLTDGGPRIVKTYTQNTPNEVNGEYILYNQQIAHAVGCVATPLGPACVEGQLLGSVGIKPFGIRLHQPQFGSYQAYALPYARIDMNLYGGMDWGIGRAGLHGRVKVLDGTIGLRAGNVDEKRPNDYCATVELDELTMIDGTLYAEVHGKRVDDLFPGARTNLDALCTNVGSVVDLVQSAQDGLLQTRDDAVDTVKDGGDKIRDTGTSIVTHVAGASSSKTEETRKKIGLYATGYSTFPNLDIDLARKPCGWAQDKMDQIDNAGYSKELHHWGGVHTPPHHRFWATCRKAQ